jgi:hypothetical protein
VLHARGARVAAEERAVRSGEARKKVHPRGGARRLRHAAARSDVGKTLSVGGVGERQRGRAQRAL